MILALHPTPHKQLNANAQRGSSPNHHFLWCLYSLNGWSNPVQFPSISGGNQGNGDFGMMLKRCCIPMDAIRYVICLNATSLFANPVLCFREWYRSTRVGDEVLFTDQPLKPVERHGYTIHTDKPTFAGILIPKTPIQSTASIWTRCISNIIWLLLMLVATCQEKVDGFKYYSY